MAIRVVAHVTARPETVDQIRDALLTLIEPTRAEDGCVVYELLQDTSDPTRFTFVEEWESDEALDKHMETEHFLAAVARATEFLGAPPEIRRYTVVA